MLPKRKEKLVKRFADVQRRKQRRKIGEGTRKVWCCRRHKKNTCDRANGKEHSPFFHSHYTVLPASIYPYA